MGYVILTSFDVIHVIVISCGALRRQHVIASSVLHGFVIYVILTSPSVMSHGSRFLTAFAVRGFEEVSLLTAFAARGCEEECFLAVFATRGGRDKEESLLVWRAG